MGRPDKKYVPKSEIERLSHGSFEYLIRQVNESIRSAKDKLFPDSSSFSIVSTFHGHVVVETDQGFYDVRLVRDGDRILAAGADKLVVESYDDDSMVDFLRREAGAVVESLGQGNSEDAANKLKQLITVARTAKPVSEGEMAALAIARVQADRPWKRLVQEDHDRICKVAGSSTVSTPSPKFERIVSGKVPTSALLEYAPLIRQSLSDIRDCLSSAGSSVENAKKKLSEKKGQPENLMFLAEDFGLDVAEVSQALDAVRNRVRDLRFLAEVHDAVASELSRYELTARFLDKKTAPIDGPAGPA